MPFAAEQPAELRLGAIRNHQPTTADGEPVTAPLEHHSADPPAAAARPAAIPEDVHRPGVRETNGAAAEGDGANGVVQFGAWHGAALRRQRPARPGQEELLPETCSA